MKARIKIATATTPDGGEMELFSHDRDLFIKINGHDLMHSRHHESELELARLGCAGLENRPDSAVLIGGLGMGYTLRQALDILPPDGMVTVAEIIAAVVKWNHEFIGELNGRPLDDQRVVLMNKDIVEVISGQKNSLDAILLDVDNGPAAMTCCGNSRLYGYEGITACRRALRGRGRLAVWSAAPAKDYEELLQNCGFQVRRFRVPAYKGSKSQSRFIFIAAEDKDVIPAGGSAPRRKQKRQTARAFRKTR